MSPKILLSLNLQEVNTILQALGKLPFSDVYALIHEIHKQAESQTAADENRESPEGLENS